MDEIPGFCPSPSLFATTGDWDDQLESWEGGWPWFFQILRLASLFALPMGGQVFLVIDFFFYGDGAAAAAARAEPPWSAWMNERFPMAAGDAEAS